MPRLPHSGGRGLLYPQPTAHPGMQPRPSTTPRLTQAPASPPHPSPGPHPPAAHPTTIEGRQDHTMHSTDETNNKRNTNKTIREARTNGLKQCPTCGIPLNYYRPNLPNTPTTNATGTVICRRCKTTKHDRTNTVSSAPNTVTTPDQSANLKPNFTGTPN